MIAREFDIDVVVSVWQQKEIYLTGPPFRINHTYPRSFD